MLIEALGTTILLFFIFALVDRHNRDAPGAHLAPRLFALLAGWGTTALPGPNGVWWAYIVGPLLGGPLGATLYDLLIRTTSLQEERGVVYEETAVP